MNWRALFWWRPPCLLRQVIVNTLDGKAFEGVLWRSRGAWLVMKEAAVLEAGEKPAPVDGDVVLHRSRVDFIQVLP